MTIAETLEEILVILDVTDKKRRAEMVGEVERLVRMHAAAHEIEFDEATQEVLPQYVQALVQGASSAQVQAIDKLLTQP